MVAREPAVEDREVEVEGGTLHTRTWTPDGAGPLSTPVLLFHDSLGSVSLWRDFPARLAGTTERPVVAYDRLGFGRSSPRSDMPTLDFVADEARRFVPALCAGLGIDRVIPCGHSVGGGMAIETAARHPGLCPAVVTIAAQAFVEDRTIAGIEAAKASFEDPANLLRLVKYHGEKARWVVEAWTGSWLSPGFADWGVDEALAALDCPILAIHGENDEYGTAAHPQQISRGPRGEMLLLTDTGHVPQRERPETVLKAIAGFLSAL